MRVLSACCFPTCTLYAGTPQSPRSLGESDGGCWLPGRLGGAVLTLAPPGVSQGASRRLSRPRRRQSIPQMQPRALRPQGRCQLCPPRLPAPERPRRLTPPPGRPGEAAAEAEARLPGRCAPPALPLTSDIGPWHPKSVLRVRRLAPEGRG